MVSPALRGPLLLCTGAVLCAEFMPGMSVEGG